jgi:DNA-directed RNA polymerase subunit M/transcription elongation factor TFIIS
MSQVRDIARTKFEEFLDEKNAKNLEISTYNFIIVKAKAENVERSWDNKFFRMFYGNKARSLYYNLKNGVLAEKIKNKIFKLKNIPYMKSWELWPEKYEDYFQKKLAKEMIQLQSMAEDENSTGMYQCGKCKSNCTTFFSLQTRSADEPMTNYITCKKCGHRWKD